MDDDRLGLAAFLGAAASVLPLVLLSLWLILSEPPMTASGTYDDASGQAYLGILLFGVPMLFVLSWLYHLGLSRVVQTKHHGIQKTVPASVVLTASIAMISTGALFAIVFGGWDPMVWQSAAFIFIATVVSLGTGAAVFYWVIKPHRTRARHNNTL